MHKFFRKNKNVMVWLVVIAFVVGGVLFGYGAYMSNRGQPAQTAQMATVNQEAVSYQEFYARFQQYAQLLRSAPSDLFVMYQYQTLSDLINNKLLLQEANKQQISVQITQDDVDQYIADFKASYGVDDQQINELLEKNNLTMEEWQKNIQLALRDPKLIETLMEQVTADVMVTDQEVIEEYEQVSVNAIFVQAAEDGSGKAKIEEVVAKLNTDEDFQEVAKAYSEGINQSTGGDLGFIKRKNSYLSPELTERVFALDDGQISDILEDDDGYYLIKVNQKKLAQGDDFDAEKETIKERLLNMKKSQVQTTWFEALRAEAKIKILVPELAGYHALNEKDYQGAITQFNQAIKDSPGNDASYIFLAEAYKGLGQNEQALETYQRAIENEAATWKTYYDLAMTYKDQDEVEPAIANLKKASEAAGDQSWVHERIKSAYEALGYKDLALQEQAIIDQIAAEEAAAAEAAAEEAREKQENDTTNDDSTE